MRDYFDSTARTRAAAPKHGAQSSARDQSGSVMLEFAIVVLGLVFGTVLFIDVASALTEYLRLAMVVSEGAKTAARTPALEIGAYADLDVDAAINAACQTPQQAAEPCAQMSVHQRTRFLVLNTTFQLDLPGTVIRSELIRDPLVNPTNIVRVQVSSNYRGMLLFSIPIGVVREAPYLLE